MGVDAARHHCWNGRKRKWEGAEMTDFYRLSAREAASRIAAGKLTSQALVESCLERIAAREPFVGAWTHLVADQALAEARARDQAEARGPLHGVPIGVKDIMDTADMPTGYGSRAYRGWRPASDAACVALAREAGAVILGKTVTTEFAAMSPGKTRNPHNAAHTPGGSSSGSAAAVADFMVPLAFGTQTAGSIIRPASFCGAIGYKPSFGLIATSGTKPLAPGLDTIGGFARSIADIALFAAALSGRPELVPTEKPARPRLGFYRTQPWQEAQPATIAALDWARERLARAGAEISDRAPFAPFDRLGEAQVTIMNYEAARNLAWERRNRASEIMPRTAALLESGLKITAEAYDAARRGAAAARAQLGDFFGACEAMLVPAAPGEAPPLATTGDPVFNRPWTLLHLPCVSLPGYRGANGLPVGVQLVGRAGEDARLLAIAQFAEAALA
jgi:Asp-tRNA(Asn)/Glu-tRNA(Gln) amidotransferase A subunit family amidase